MPIIAVLLCFFVKVHEVYNWKCTSVRHVWFHRKSYAVNDIDQH
jgi:hypothetical protein